MRPLLRAGERECAKGLYAFGTTMFADVAPFAKGAFEEQLRGRSGLATLQALAKVGRRLTVGEGSVLAAALVKPLAAVMPRGGNPWSFPKPVDRASIEATMKWARLIRRVMPEYLESVHRKVRAAVRASGEASEVLDAFMAIQGWVTPDELLSRRKATPKKLLSLASLMPAQMAKTLSDAMKKNAKLRKQFLSSNLVEVPELSAVALFARMADSQAAGPIPGWMRELNVAATKDVNDWSDLNARSRKRPRAP